MQLTYHYYLTVLVMPLLFYLSQSAGSAPLIYTRDVYMGSYPVGMVFTIGFGPSNFTTTFPHAPDIFPTSLAYKLLISSSYNADYTITSKTISLAVQIKSKNLTHISASLYSDYTENVNGYTYIQVLVLDVLSSVYQYILPSVLRFQNRNLMSTTISTNVSVSTFNSTNLTMSNDLVVYSFLAGFIIQSQTTTLQFQASSEILDAATIRVNISSIVNLINVTWVRIDTVVIDKTQITATKLRTLDFQTADCPICSYKFIFANYLDNNQNIFTGLSQFNLNKLRFKFDLTLNPGNITILLSSTYNFTRIVFRNLHFVVWKCPTGFPYFDIPTNLCYDTSCPAGNYRVAIPVNCLPCLYDCVTCVDGATCSTCNSTLDFRALDLITQRCLPLPGYYDDGTNNAIAKPCSLPCVECLGSATYCLTCVNDTLYPLNGVCTLCNSTMIGCITCNNSITCTSNQNGYYIQQSVCGSFICYLSVQCIYFCQTCDNGFNCTVCNSSNYWQLDPNNYLCIAVNGYYDNGNNSIAQPCQSPCENCQQTASNCTSCVNTTYYLQLNQCLQCSIAILNCQTCTSSTNCTQCQTSYFVDGGLCATCLYSCLTCDNPINCTSCNSSDFRQLNSNTSQCDPMNGYFDDGTNNSMTQPCDPICITCSGSATYCTSCPNDTYYLLNGHCNLCNSTLIGCITCNDVTTCTSCETAYFLMNQTCGSCLYSCQTCNTTDTCTTCNSSTNRQLNPNTSQCDPMNGYFDDGTNNSMTQPCDPICITCSGSATYCTSCPNDTYYLLNGHCNLCNSTLIGCITCNDVTTCTSCETAYFLMNQTCGSCLYSCQTCNTTDTCTTCNSSTNRQLNPNTSQCDPMNGYFDDGTNNSITQPCDPICITCSGSATYCTSCPNDTYYLLNGHCNLCNSTLTGCITCNDVTTCTSCENAYFLMNQTCGSCLYSCQTCNTTDACTTCNSSTNRQLNLNTSQCDPINGYYDDGTNNSMALPCSDPCLTCQIGPNICITCVNDTYAVNPLNSQCNLCSTLLVNCETCFSANTCTLCSAGPYYLSPATSGCSSTNCTVCANCLYDCYTCDNGNNCTSCNATTDFRQLSSNSSRCVPLSGYFDDGHSTIAQPCSFPCLDCSTTAVLCTSCINDTYGINLINSHCQLCSDLISGCDQCMNSSSCLVCQVGYFMTSTFKCTSTCGDSFLNTLKQECDDGNNYNGDGCDTYCNIQNGFNCTLSGQTSVCIYLGQVQLSIDTVIKTPNKNQVQLLISYGPSNLRAWQDVNFSQILGTTVPYSSIKVVPGNNGQLTLVLDYTQDISNTNQNFTLDPSLSGLTVFSLTPQSNTSCRMVSANNQPTYFYPESVYDLQALLNNVGMGVSILALLGFALSIFGPKLIGTEMIMVFQFTFLSLMDINDLNPIFNALKSLKITMGYSLFSDDQTVYDSNSPYEVRGAPMYSQFVKNYNLIIVLILLPLLIGLIVKLLVRFSLIDKSNILARNKKYLIGEYTFMGAAFGANCIFVSLFLQVFYGKKDMTTMIGLISLGVCVLMPIFVIAYGILLYKKPKMFRNYTTESFKINFQSGFCLGTVCLSLIISLIMTLGVDLKFAIPICIGVYTGIFIFIIIKKPYLGRGNIRSCANIVILIAVMGMMIMYRVLDNNFRQNGMGIYIPIAVLACLIICLCYNMPILIYNIAINLKSCGKFDQLDDEFIKQDMLNMRKDSIIKSPMSSIADKFFNIGLKNNFEDSTKMQRYQELLKSIPKLTNKEKKVEQIQNKLYVMQQYKKLDNNSLLDKNSGDQFSQMEYEQSQIQNLKNLSNDDNDGVQYANSPQTRRSPRKQQKSILNNSQDMSDIDIQERSIIQQESCEEDAI